MDKKGITVFILITFGAGYALQAGLGWLGLIHLSEPNIFQRILLLALLFIPALGYLIARNFGDNNVDARGAYRFWPLPKRPLAQTIITMTVTYGLVHVLLALSGLQQPQWRMGTLMNNINATLVELQQPPMSETVASIAPGFLLVSGLLLSIVLGATLYAVVALSMIYAWHGYLLPRLMPLGKTQAYLLTGLIAGLWFLPLFVLYHLEGNQYGAILPTLVQFLAAAILLGALAGAILQRTKHMGLAAVALGVYLGQAMGIWTYLFPVVNPPWSGPTGLVALALLGVLVCRPVLVTGPLDMDKPSADDDAVTPTPVSQEESA